MLLRTAESTTISNQLIQNVKMKSEKDVFFFLPENLLRLGTPQALRGPPRQGLVFASIRPSYIPS